MNSGAQLPVSHRLRLGSRWWAFLAFWIFLGFVIANQIYWGMKDHGHSWWRLFLWQAGACGLWTVLAPVVFTLFRRFPFDRRFRAFLVHVPAALVLGAVHLVPVTLLALLLNPYWPMAEARSFSAEYRFMTLNWLGQDVLTYAAVLGLAAIIDARDRRKNQRLRESVLQAELARAELRALRLELQPHFIFNALNAVVGLLRRSDPEGAEKMLIGLSDLLRLTLDGRGRQQVTLTEELRLVQLYLDIQQIRFGDQLEVALVTEPGTECALVPSLLLQPLVENAIRHGMARQSRPSRIEVRSQRKERRLVLKVTDNGPGPDEAESGRGIGFDNVSSRLEALYAGNWSLDLRAGADGGAEVHIELPWLVDSPSEAPSAIHPLAAGA